VESLVESLRIWLESTALAKFMIDSDWAWPIAESIHFIGLSLLIGTVGLFDLRLLGLAKRIPIGALHRLIPWGVAGYCMNIATGLSFFTAAPGQYIYNPAFQIKMLLMAIAGLNVLAFYAVVYRRVAAPDSPDSAPFYAKMIGAVSLCAWIGVISCGRLLTFFRPPWHWCPWC